MTNEPSDSDPYAGQVPSPEALADTHDMLQEVEGQMGLGSLGGEEETDENDQLWNTLERMAREIDELQRFRRLVFWGFCIALVLSWCAGIWAAAQ